MSTDFTAEHAKLTDALAGAKTDYARAAFASLDDPKLTGKVADLEREIAQYELAINRLNAAEQAATEAAGQEVVATIEARRKDAAKAADNSMSVAVREAGRLDELLNELSATLDRLEAAHNAAADAVSAAAQAAADLVPGAGGLVYPAAVNLVSSARGVHLRSPLLYKLSQVLTDRALLGQISWSGLVQADEPLVDAAKTDAAAVAVVKTWTAANLTNALAQRREA